MIKSNILLSFLMTITAIFAASCISKMYTTSSKDKLYVGEMSGAKYLALRQFLYEVTNAQPKDTIIIKYDYNYEDCWDMLDYMRSNGEIQKTISNKREALNKMVLSRPSTSIYSFREPGRSVNKIIKFDKSIILDQKKVLFNLFFKERCNCGSSIIVMPDKKFVFIRSDSHSIAIWDTKNQVKHALPEK